MRSKKKTKFKASVHQGFTLGHTSPPLPIFQCKEKQSKSAQGKLRLNSMDDCTILAKSDKSMDTCEVLKLLGRIFSNHTGDEFIVRKPNQKNKQNIQGRKKSNQL